MIIEKISQVPAEGVFDDLTVDENKALIDLMVFAVLADECITDLELKQFDVEISQLPFVNDTENQQEIVDHAAKTRRNLEDHLSDEEYIKEFFHGVSERMKNEKLRKVAIKMFCHVIMVDGLDEGEKERCYQVAETFGIGTDVVDAIISRIISEADTDVF